MDEPQTKGGTRGQWMNHKGERRGHKGAMDEPQGGNEGGTRGQWMGTKGAQGGNG